MKFSIITPTYKRNGEIKNACESVLAQDYDNWEMIIVNDSPDFDYSDFEKYLEIKKDARIKYFKNKNNMGVNFSRNFALGNIAKDSHYFIFLDDDDWLNKEALIKARKIIEQNPKQEWFVSNRFSINQNKSLTKNKTDRYVINYISDYLILKKFNGDVTHIVSTKYKNARFSKKIKNAEEWIFFLQIPKKFYYYDFNSTYTEGYNESGITNSYKNKIIKIKNTFILARESLEYKVFSPILCLYLILRIFAVILKK